MKIKKKTVGQFIKFGIVGLSNTILSYAINVAVLFILKDKNLRWDYIAGNIISFGLSILWSFYWNNKYVFKKQEGEKRSIGKALLKTYIAYGFTGILLNNILSWIWIDKLSVSKYIAPILNLIISVPLNFVIKTMIAQRAEPKQDTIPIHETTEIGTLVKLNSVSNTSLTFFFSVHLLVPISRFFLV